MTTITLSRAVAAQMLEALEDWDSPMALPAVVALRAALAQQAEPMYDRAALDAAVAAERERCAKICEAQEYSYWRATDEQDFTPQDCADAIRRA